MPEEERAELQTALEASGDGSGPPVVPSSFDDFAKQRIVLLGDVLAPSGAAGSGGFVTGIRRPIIEGSGKNDLLTGSGELETIVGLGGRDTIRGDAGSDLIYGGDGNDKVFAGDGDDFVLPSRGNDTVRGGSGDDDIELASEGGGTAVASGGDGNDRIISGWGSGDDKLSGGSGNDSISGGNGMDTIEGGDGNDLITGTNPLEVLGLPFPESREGEDGSDLLRGGKGNDLISGGAGEDSLDGGDGNDTLFGAGSSTPLGAEQASQSASLETRGFLPDGNKDGSDFLTGGSGADVFVVGERIDESFFEDPFVQGIVDATGIDIRRDFFYDGAGENDRAVIEDFNSTEDKIQLRGAAGDYVLDVRGGGTSIALDQDNNSVFNSGDEELAFVKGNNDLDLNSVDFSFV